MPFSTPIDEDLMRELMRSISHDLRNPLAAVVTNLAFSRGLIDDQSAREDVVEAIDDSVIACDVMQMIVANLDILLKSAGPAPTLHGVTVTAAVHDVVKRFRPRAVQARVELCFDAVASPAQALLDRTHFALAVENLIANGVTHTPKGGRVDVSTELTDHKIMVHIDDDGLVIPEELRLVSLSPRAHTRHGRREKTRYSRGLGLLSASRAAMAAGATMTLHEVNDRNRFTLHTLHQGSG